MPLTSGKVMLRARNLYIPCFFCRVSLFFRFFLIFLKKSLDKLDFSCIIKERQRKKAFRKLKTTGRRRKTRETRKRKKSSCHALTWQKQTRQNHNETIRQGYYTSLAGKSKGRKMNIDEDAIRELTLFTDNTQAVYRGTTYRNNIPGPVIYGTGLE